MRYYDSMQSWASRRKTLVVLGGITTFLVVVGLYGGVSLLRQPNCLDETKNGDERGVDCGGKCPRVCRADTQPLVVRFARALEVDKGVWGAVAYVENRNTGAGARDVPYVFKLYDAQNILLYERSGQTYVPPRKAFDVFEGRMLSGSRIPARATFEFKEQPTFLRIVEQSLVVETKGLESGVNGSRLQAIIRNPTRTPQTGIEATALIFSADENVIAASATVVKELAGEGSTIVTFTWPAAFADAARTEVLYTVPGSP
ncbi:MAG: hypothetical protein Q7R93_05270 [bacterium]|nr:hypothetical protein [bacterium]